MSNSNSEKNPVLEFALDYQFPAFSDEGGVDKVVAFGDHSHKCPVYVQRVPPCTAGCPAGEDIRGYHNILRGVEKFDNPWEAAFYRITDKNPFPAIMGRVCPAPCQSKCNRQYFDETVGINAVEHAIGEYALANNLKFTSNAASTGKKVAVVGAGPAGLSAAYQLRRLGHAVTIYEAQKKLGGMVRYGIMGYRVDRNVLDKEIARIIDLGVEVKTGMRIGKDITLEQLGKQYNAVFLGVGAQKGRNLPVAGSEGTAYASNAIAFLMDYEANGNKMTIGKKVIVVGDGDVAMDVARLGLRLGSQSTLVSAVPREEMNCSAYEFDEAKAEGTVIQYGVGVVEVLRNGDKVRGVKCVKMEKKAKGEDGWNSPVPFLRYKPVAGSEFEIEGDMVVAAIGQMTDMSGLEAATANTPWLQVTPVSYQIKGMDNVFGGGDAIKIDLITTAVGHGRMAAEAIDAFLNQQPLPSKTRQDIVPFQKLASGYFVESKMKRRSHNHVSNVNGNFDELLVALQQSDAKAESERCMSCGLCFECRECQKFCPQEAISYFKNNPVGEVMYTDYNRCVGCHICHDVCPTGYIDMAMGEGM